MTREEAKELLPIIKAYIEGKEIEYFVSTKSEWDLITDPIFDDEPSKYRIKTETKYRPFKSVEECWEEMQKHQPFGWIKNKNTNKLYNILTIYKDEDTINISVENFLIKPFTLFESFIFIDGSPLGIKKEK